ncbi:hypothetical protein SLEP1_g13532 [Rubroshorea leprosula]|uniref:Integrase catalytic domain-containing protein n=1 Tax=Rubroshorea leprosula TaxID=152421 RepID=A0AAV5IRT4_9ROSI|nr:hypothetical protein SLEP1_g13532 [Rubroshorea leprosula]
MVETRSVRAGNSSQPPGRGGDENQPHNSAHNSASTTNHDVVAIQLAAMQQQFGVFQLVLAQLLARHNPGDPLLNLLNPAPQPPAPQQNPEPIQIPQLETYDGTKDPDDHLHAFYSCMQAQNASDALMYKIFPSTLRGNARTWYYSLPPRSISSYTEMTSAFATKFSSRRLIGKTTSEMMRVRQRDGKSLKNFMSRFNDAVLEVNSFDQAVGITAVISGLSHERFRDSLLKHPATTFSKEADEDTTELRSDADFHTEIWKAELRTPIATCRSRSYNKTMQQLKSQGVRHPPNREGVGYQQTPPSLPPPARIIHMIMGGLEAGGLSSKQRKLYVREVKHQNRAQKRKFDDAEWKNQPITFTPADLDTVVTPHNDPLVTSVTINNCEVQRVLVDKGSAPDIMYFHCFESLGLDSALLQRYDGPIYGFNNQPVPIEGVLTMNVAFGSGRNYVTPPVRFLVVKMASSFNVVIGRPILTEIRAVVSQSHLCMKFPTPTRIATLRGNQEVARHCYITSVTQPQKGKDQPPEVNPKRIPDNWQVMGVEIVDNRPEDETRAAPVEKVEEDCYPMPNIDKLVEAASGNERLSLLDAYSGYHQVPMAPEDEEKISFYAGDEIYCYVMMPFGLKNAVVKSLKAEDHLADLEETFNNLRKNRMRLNPAKCIFGVESGKVLGFMVSRRGVEVNPEKIKAVAEMEPPKSVKDVQRLTGRVAALHRFISKSADKCLPFFKIMRLAAQKDESGKQKKFEWNPECQDAFDELKSYLSSPPLLTKAKDGEILYLYLGISDEAISSVLIREEGKQQKPVYYINSVLHGAEVRYSIAEKAALAVVTSARKLRPYFQSHPIIVLTDQPLRQILHKPKCSGRLIKWAVELGEFELTFQQRSAIRAQALADFIVECTSIHSDSQFEVDSWILYVDGASSNKGSGAGALLLGPEGYRSEHALKFNFDATNNMAEYEALLLSLQLATELKVEAIQIYSDSQLVVNQKFHLSKIPRAENEQADSLSKFVSDGNQSSRSVFVEILDEPSFVKPQVMKISTDPSSLSWTNPIISFLRDGTVPTDKPEEMRCQKCQFFAHLIHQPAEELTTLVAPWPFAQWGLDLLGPFMKGVRGVTHLIVGVDYFTKWVEARALSNLTSKKVEDFVFSSIICRYGIPNQIVADNGTQFNCSSFRDFCSSYGIKLQFTSVYHPESNGMVESVNKCILEGIEPRLEQHEAKWADKLNNVLWAYKTTS